MDLSALISNTVARVPTILGTLAVVGTLSIPTYTYSTANGSNDAINTDYNVKVVNILDDLQEGVTDSSVNLSSFILFPENLSASSAITPLIQQIPVSTLLTVNGSSYAVKQVNAYDAGPSTVAFLVRVTS